jgi:hypothetical protein
MAKKNATIRALSDPDPMRKTQYVVRASHVLALRQEAYSRAATRISGGPDASAVLREILDAWIAKNAGKR